MAYINVVEWTPEHTAEWLQGLDDGIVPYAHFFLNNNIDGRRLLTLVAEDLVNLNVNKIGHQELILEAVDLLRQLQYNLTSENLQSLSLKLSCKAWNLFNELKLNGPLEASDNKKQEKVSTATLSAVSDILVSVKSLISWLDRYPFCGQDQYTPVRKTVLKLSIELASTAQRDQFVEKPHQVIKNNCLNLAELCDKVIQEYSDSLLIQPASLDVATVKKKSDEELGMHIHSSYSGVHMVGGVKFQSPAHRSGRIEEGDEIVQVNYQTVVGWQLKRLVNAMREHPTEAHLTLKKRPRHVNNFGQVIVLRPYRIPSKKSFFGKVHKWSEGSSLHIQAYPEQNSQPVITRTEPDDEDDSAFLPDDTAVGQNQVMHAALPVHYNVFPAKSRATVQRRATVSGASPTITRPPVNIEELVANAPVLKKKKDSITRSISHDPANLTGSAEGNGKAVSPRLGPITSTDSEESLEKAKYQEVDFLRKEPVVTSVQRPVTVAAIRGLEKVAESTSAECRISGSELVLPLQEEDYTILENKSLHTDSMQDSGISTATSEISTSTFMGNKEEDREANATDSGDNDAFSGSSTRGVWTAQDTTFGGRHLSARDISNVVAGGSMCNVENQPVLTKSQHLRVSKKENDNCSYEVTVVGGVPHKRPTHLKEENQVQSGYLRRKPHLPSRLATNRRISCKDLGMGDCEGWLYYKKERHGILTGARWTKCWVILKKHYLYCYQSKENEKADCLVYIPGFTVSPALESKSKKYAFKLYHPGTTFYFASDSQQDMVKWLNKLGLAAIAFDPSSILPTNRSELDKAICSENAYFSETEEESEESSPGNNRRVFHMDQHEPSFLSGSFSSGLSTSESLEDSLQSHHGDEESVNSSRLGVSNSGGDDVANLRNISDNNVTSSSLNSSSVNLTKSGFLNHFEKVMSRTIVTSQPTFPPNSALLPYCSTASSPLINSPQTVSNSTSNRTSCSNVNSTSINSPESVFASDSGKTGSHSYHSEKLYNIHRPRRGGTASVSKKSSPSYPSKPVHSSHGRQTSSSLSSVSSNSSSMYDSYKNRIVVNNNNINSLSISMKPEVSFQRDQRQNIPSVTSSRPNGISSTNTQLGNTDTYQKQSLESQYPWPGLGTYPGAEGRQVLDTRTNRFSGGFHHSLGRQKSAEKEMSPGFVARMAGSYNSLSQKGTTTPSGSLERLRLRDPSPAPGYVAKISGSFDQLAKERAKSESSAPNHSFQEGSSKPTHMSCKWEPARNQCSSTSRDHRFLSDADLQGRFQGTSYRDVGQLDHDVSLLDKEYNRLYGKKRQPGGKPNIAPQLNRSGSRTEMRMYGSKVPYDFPKTATSQQIHHLYTSRHGSEQDLTQMAVDTADSRLRKEFMQQQLGTIPGDTSGLNGSFFPSTGISLHRTSAVHTSSSGVESNSKQNESKSGHMFRLFGSSKISKIVSPKQERKHIFGGKIKSPKAERKKGENKNVTSSRDRTFLGSPKLGRAIFGSPKSDRKLMNSAAVQTDHSFDPLIPESPQHLDAGSSLRHSEESLKSSRLEELTAYPDISEEFLKTSSNSSLNSSASGSVVSSSSSSRYYVETRIRPQITISLPLVTESSSDELPDTPRTPLKPTMGVSMLGKRRTGSVKTPPLKRKESVVESPELASSKNEVTFKINASEESDLDKDELVQLASVLRKANLTVDGVDIYVRRRRTMFEASENKRESQLMLQYLALKRTLKDREAELSAIDDLLVENVTSAQLEKWACKYPHLLPPGYC
ncbi:uncharacterized protein LOC106478730 isoform X2 [Limulus polyphemus]|uniref:Uncharacterized protein LOC106478730 isoform X2 n=1 Tax=Limulus polyphemus TaxID=6850 RepID=A0ABM1C5U5_LIMPO|nr:uncharacterized protein LOC106478730 isoform X2 [Limulus polyphemus]